MSFDELVRKHFWIVPLPLLALAAFLDAQAVMQLVGAGMQLDPRRLAEAPPLRDVPPRASTRVPTAAPILRRNPFDSVTGAIIDSPATEPADAASATIDSSDPLSAPRCEGVRVKAIAASRDVDWSFAAIAGADNKSHLLRRGGELGARRVYFIGWDRLWLSGEGGLCQAELFDPAARPAPASPRPVASAPSGSAPRGASLSPELRKGIQKISDTEYNIERGVVDQILENQAQLMRQARVVPVQENGRVVGVRLMGLRPDTVLGALGMQNGDLLRTINGFELASPEKALEAYARLRSADKLTIQLHRAGKNLNLDYNIR